LTRHWHGNRAIAAALFFLLLSSSPAYSQGVCFVPKKGSGGNATFFVAPKSKVCRAFQRELNANCTGEIPTVEFKPKLRDSGLTEPAWQPIALYTPDGAEDTASFQLLEKLIWSRAITKYSADRELTAKRDVDRILGEIRKAHASNLIPRFDKVSLDLEGRGQEEALYRLFSGLLRNPTSINDQNSSFKSEPNLFLGRALALALSGDVAKVSPDAAGNAATLAPADVLLFDGTPYFLKWSGGNSLYVYDSHIQPNRPRTPDEINEGRTFVSLQLRCMFDSRPTH
jgi:hypothetical protein